MYVITVAIAQPIGEVRVAWNEIMAGAVIATLPALIFYAFLERNLIQVQPAGGVIG